MKRIPDMVKEPHPSTPDGGLLRRPVPLAEVWEEMVAQAAKTPWMVQSLMIQGRKLASRVTAQYLRLRRLPRRVRRLLARRGALSLVGAALLLALAEPEAGWAGTTISVSSGDELASAITLANTQTGNYAGTNTLTLTTNIAVESALDPVTSTIVIDGNNYLIAGSSNLTDSIFIIHSNGKLTLNETTVTGGKGDNGGAIYNHGTLTLSQSTLSGNTVSGKGGALFNRYGTVTLTNSTLENNSAANSGGGLYNYGGHVTLTEESLVTGNRASSGGGLGNGHYGRLTVSYSTVTDNTAAEGGGLLHNTKASSVTVTTSTVSGNTATDQGGGGIHVNYGSVTVNEGSLISNNQGEAGGGLYINKVATATIANSTVSGNVATNNGGGIYVHSGSLKDEQCVTSQCSISGCFCTAWIPLYGSKLTMTYSTLANNTATFGGGINTSRYTSVTLTNSTLSGNSASESGGGLNASPNGSDSRAHITLSSCTLTGNTAVDEGGGISTGEHTDLTLKDTLVSGNHAPTGREVRTNTNHSTISFGHNNLFGYSGSSGLSGQGSGSTDIIPSVPLSAILDTTLAGNGGETETHALVSGSPAINAASTSCPPPSLDQRGYSRPASGSTICDIGAYEFGATETTVPAALTSAQATNVETGKPTGSVQLVFRAVLSQALDLSRAAARLRQAMVERGRELVEGLHDPTVELRRLEGAKKDRASFATAADVRPKIRMQAQIKKGLLQITLRVDQAWVERPLFCNEGVTDLASELVLSDGKLPSVRLQLEELWTCQTRTDGKITGLVVGQR